jgi:hypothetical protein
MRGAGSAAMAAVGEGEGTQRGTDVGASGGHGSLQKKDFKFWIFGGASPSARRGSERG